MKFQPKDFNQVTEAPIGLGMRKIENEEFAAYVLNRHIKADQEFDIPFSYKNDHSNMAPEFLNDHGERKYTLTRKSLALLWAKYGKE
ncbi:MAG: hypothetical protein WCT49_00670 [Candidatus Paceibacterota bacterium]|jgi:hypothetical protein|nr:hypothetical protein [Candidatus Paceibacterota bacterium]